VDQRGALFRDLVQCLLEVRRGRFDVVLHGAAEAGAGD
jgi:hypothetical protein